ncbi:MAG: hypothetical protein PHI05_03110 [Bacilli bacterium]|nr:hypothetical protein [Bacilli bacterium]MDD4547711.1 hypothetical protein [Bacilli bacterium]
MGLFNKIKDLFTDVVEEQEPIKKEVIKVEIASPTKDEPEKVNVISDSDVVNNIEKNPTPVFFSDSDFEDLRSTSLKKNQVNKTRYNYNESLKEKEKEKPKVFKPSPIISPIYGILDKNYSKDDISVKQKPISDVRTTSNEISIDLVRKKAFGTLEEELESEILSTNSILFKEEIVEPVEKDLFEELKNKEEIKYHNNEDEEDLFENITLTDVDLDEEVNSSDNMIASEIERMFDEEDDKITEGELFELIDSMYERGDDTRE